MSEQRPVALVTGAGRGIGAGISLCLAEAGFDLLLNAPHDSENLQQVKAQVEERGAAVRTLQLDIAEVSRHAAAVEEAFGHFGQVDCLVNNAGIPVDRRADVLELTPEAFDHQLSVNLRGTFFLTQAMAKAMLARPTDAFRSIITISSSNAEAVAVDRAEYCMAKSALSMMSRVFAVRLAEAGIRTYEVRPGLIETDMTRPVKDRYDRLLEQGFSPINRWGQPEDVGSAVAALASGSMAFATGEALHLDGGLLIRHY